MSRTEFKALQKEWYRKLKDGGFRDLEKGDTFASQGWFAGKFQFEYRAAPVRWKNKEDYFRLCGEFLHSFKFRSPKERRMWELHTEGWPDEKIAASFSKPLTRKVVWNILTKLEKRMLTGRAVAEKAQLGVEAVRRTKAQAQRILRALELEEQELRRTVKENAW